MLKGFWGKKIGMTQIISELGVVIPVTVVDVSGWVVTQLKNLDRDGYNAIQVGNLKSAKSGVPFSIEWLKKPLEAFSFFKEIHCDDGAPFKVGSVLSCESIFQVGTQVNVFGKTIGRGFQGGVKRHGFAGGPATHGDDLGRRPGSIGFMRSRGRVIKGWRMAGHMGNEQVVMRNLKIMKMELDSQVILINGSVPGKTGSLLFMQKV